MKLIKPIVFFDLETTGTNTTADRIVSIATIKIFPDGTREKKKKLINPGMPIPAGATAVHGITNDDVKDAPYFKQFAQSLLNYIAGCDLGGFNSDKFDIPLLGEELKRSGFDFPTEQIARVDVLSLYRVLFPNTLTEIYKRLFGFEFDGAHDAEADVIATIEILEKLIEDKPEITPAEIDEFCQGENKRVDFYGALYEKDGVTYFAFGKNKDKDVRSDKGYNHWFLGADFPKETKEKLKAATKV